MASQINENDSGGNELDIENLIDERERLERMFHDKFTKIITVMFTDLKGSTSIADIQGDLAHRTLIKYHNDILFPIISKNNGILVKTMGDGTMSYFSAAQDALRAASQIQNGIESFNLKKTLPDPMLIRIGIHVGKGIVEQTDIFGDVVNVASRLESQANPGEILMSEDTYNALADKSEIYCRFLKSATLKGKKDSFSIYKAFWNPTEIERDMAADKPLVQEFKVKRGVPLVAKIVIGFILLLILFLIIKETEIFKFDEASERRTERHSVTIP